MLKHIISSRDFSRDVLTSIIQRAWNLSPFEKVPSQAILATLFFEASTRTRLSFESAMFQIGGKVIGFSDPSGTSLAKGESFLDTIRTVAEYCNVMVIRHPLEGSARLAQDAVGDRVHLVNAGDGGGQHPTQMLCDLLSIFKAHKRLDNLKIGYIGDLKYGRTVHSLVQALSLFSGIEHYFIAPDQSLQIEKDHIDETVSANYVSNIKDVVSDLDVLYVTRLQKERFPDPLEYNRIIRTYQITPEQLKCTKPEFIVLHPLPRNSEIRKDVDALPCAKYFDQVHNGVIVRKRILLDLLNVGYFS